MKIKREISVEIQVTTREAAKVFCDMDADEQAKFFGFISEISDVWTHPLCFQLYAITNSKNFNKEAKRVMEQIGDYGGIIRGN